jgi:AcrR family transcriptional regulator
MTVAPVVKFQRRPAERRRDITAAALEVFATRGYAAANVAEIADLAGVSKGTIFLYFASKDEVLVAAIRDSVGPSLELVRKLSAVGALTLSELIEAVCSALPHLLTDSPLGRVTKVVIAEGRAFPQLARAWFEEVVDPIQAALTEAIAAAQAREGSGPFAPRSLAFQLVSPFLMAWLLNELFGPVGAKPIELADLAEQHCETMLRGILASTTS